MSGRNDHRHPYFRQISNDGTEPLTSKPQKKPAGVKPAGFLFDSAAHRHGLRNRPFKDGHAQLKVHTSTGYASNGNPPARATPSAASEHSSELIGCPISRSFTTYCVCLELRSLASTGITRLQRCRVGGGALDCSCAGLRSPHKLDVQFSRSQLS